MAARRVMVIGLDAATLDLVRPWAQEGRLPNLARFLSDGAAGVLRSTLPPCSPAAWSTFATGMNPGQHGLLGFHQFSPHDYEPHLMNAARRRGATFWEIAGEHGVRGGVLNLPFTYPPRPYNGFLVACMLSPAVGPGMVSPPAVLADLLAASPRYAIDVDVLGAAVTRPEAFLKRVLDTTQARLEAALGLYRKHRPELFCVVFVAADRICHFFWPYMEAARAGQALSPAQQRLARGIRTVYEKLDEAVGALAAEAGADCDLLIVSDHGACGLTTGLSLRRALADGGLLVESRTDPLAGWRKRAVLAMARRAPRTLKRRLMAAFPRLAVRAATAAEGLGADLRRTRAYPTGWTQGVFVNLKGRQPLGTVEPGAQYEAVRDEVIAVLSGLRDPQTGRPAMKKVHRREEVWSGQCLDELPDLVVEPADPSYALSTLADQRGRGVFYDLPAPSWTALHSLGGHHGDGLVMAMGPHVRKAAPDGPVALQGAQMADVPATILALLGCPIPANFEGRVLTEMLTDDVCVAAGTAPAPVAADHAEAGEPAGQDRAAVEKRLKTLGYM